MKSAFLALALPLAACAALDDGKGPEDDVPVADGKDDSLRKPTEHGALAFGAPVVETLSRDEGHHAWTFTLTGAAEVDLFTGPPAASSPEVDTVLYLYRQRDNGSWGSYIARNDDAGDTLWSSLDRSLGAGTYRVTVKGYQRSVRGDFALTVACDGAGCGVDDRTCVLGDTYREIETQPGLQLINRNKVTVETEWLDDVWAQRIVLAVQQSSHTDVTTMAEAFARVDQNEMNISWYADTAARRRFIAVEYGAGDNSYGAVFDEGTAIVASIHDGDLLNCTTAPATCVLPETYGDLRADPAFTAGTTRVITAAEQVSGAEAAQVLAALASVYEPIYGAPITSLAEALTYPDGGQVNLTAFTHVGGTALTAVEFGAGDTSVGLVFYGATTETAAVINDFALERCTFFAD